MRALSILLLLFTTTASIAMDMGIDNERDHEDVHGSVVSSPSSSNGDSSASAEFTTTIASLHPTPHVMKHQHGAPILETHLLPEERLFGRITTPLLILLYHQTIVLPCIFILSWV